MSELHIFHGFFFIHYKLKTLMKILLIRKSFIDQYSKSSELTPAIDNTFTELSSRKLFGASQLVSEVEQV